MRTHQDPDVQTVLGRDQKHGAEPDPHEPLNNQVPVSEGTTPIRQGGESMCKKILVGVMITVIIVLVILLIYQLYKYYTGEPPLGSDACLQPIANKAATVAQHNTLPPQPTTDNLPDSVRNLDSSVLKQFINKSNNTPKPQQNTSKSHMRNAAESTLVTDTQQPTPTYVEEKENERLSQIIGDVMDGDDPLPTREEMTELMSKDMDGEASRKQMIHDMGTTMGSDMGSYPDDVVKCSQPVGRGKDRAPCGNTCMTGDRCAKHARK
jgi:hypothetical protein